MNPPMRKILLGLGVSLDGHIARLAGTLDFLFIPKDYSMAPFFWTVDKIKERKASEVFWRKRMGVEPIRDAKRLSPVLKTGTITGPHALP
jgi:hypothetical protein